MGRLKQGWERSGVLFTQSCGPRQDGRAIVARCWLALRAQGPVGWCAGSALRSIPCCPLHTTSIPSTSQQGPCPWQRVQGQGLGVHGQPSLGHAWGPWRCHRGLQGGRDLMGGSCFCSFFLQPVSLRARTPWHRCEDLSALGVILENILEGT